MQKVMESLSDPKLSIVQGYQKLELVYVDGNGVPHPYPLDMFEKVQGKRIGRWLGNHLAPDLRIKSRKEGGYVLVFGKKALEKPQITDGDVESSYEHWRNFNEYQKEDSRREDKAKPAYR